jgi:hypothetical protein
MICPMCNQDNVEMMVDVTMIIPSHMESRLSKTNIKSKDVQIYAVNWPRATYLCKTMDCGWIQTNRY